MNVSQWSRLFISALVGIFSISSLHYCTRQTTVTMQETSLQTALPSQRADMIELGDATSSSIWIYLCGLTPSFDTADEVAKRALLDKIGTKLHIKFIALKPPQRCPEFDNRLCWPHTKPEEVAATYDYIRQMLKDIPYTGLIGFSNGSYFLTKLVQSFTLNKPVIAVGGAVYLSNTQQPNTVHLLVGTQDTYNYDVAQKFYVAARTSSLKAFFHGYDGGHELPEQPLGILLEKVTAIGRQNPTAPTT